MLLFISFLSSSLFSYVLNSLSPQLPICCSLFVFKLYHKIVNISTATLDYMRKVRTVFCPDFLAQS